jgi:dihydrodiol dehydrogenase / D-xylose 1-dehydrogenase (NADP)
MNSKVSFDKDLLLDPVKTRNVQNLVHRVVAVGSSSSVDSARRFTQEIGSPQSACYGSYEELAQDPKVDVIYVAS